MSTNYDALPEKPRPQPAPENEPYWEGLKTHRLMIQQCSGCGALRHYPRPMCDRCYSMEYGWQEVDGRGDVHSWTVTHHPFHPGFKRDVPYITVTVDLDCGVRLQAPLVGAGAEALRTGLPLIVGFEDIDTDLTLPVLRPVTA